LKLGQYLHVLKKELPGMLKDVSHQIRRHIWIQYYGAPPHKILFITVLGLSVFFYNLSHFQCLPENGFLPVIQ
jgi:hypothetical protein